MNYDHQFNGNEWFILAATIIFHLFMFVLPKRFPISVSINLYLLAFTAGILFDNSMGAYIFDFYDIGDSSKYTWMDILSYVAYSPFGYLFAYFIDRFRLKGANLISYILIWSLFSWGFEALATSVGVFHYKNGYHIYHSLPIYIISIFFTYFFYKILLFNRSTSP